MITRVRVKNFRSLADVDVTLGPLTVLVGRNGAGKSAFLDVMRFVRDALRSGMDTAIMERNGIHALRRWMPEAKGNTASDIEITLDVEGLSAVGRYTLRIAEPETDVYAITQEDCQFGEESFTAAEGKAVVHGFFGAGEQVTGLLNSKNLMLPALRAMGGKTLDILYELLTTLNVYTINPEYLRNPQKISMDTFLKEHAENLAVCLKQVQQSSWSDRLQNLFYLISGVTGVRTEHAGSYLLTRTQHVMRSGDYAWFDLAQESDGTIRLLALLVALYQDVTDAVIAIEEPELSLHPGALSAISEAIKEASLRNQIIVATQSPEFMSEFDVDQLLAVDRLDEVTYIGPLLPHQRDVIRRKLFTAGELMLAEGLRTTPFATVSAADA